MSDSGIITGRFSVSKLEEGQRLDKYLTNVLGFLSRQKLQKALRHGTVKVNDKPVKKSYKLKANDIVEVEIPVIRESRPDLVPEDIPIEVVYEDPYLVVINKPPGLVVHPAPGNWSGTLVNALLHRYGNLEVGDSERPGIVHRLDKDTSGLMVVALTEKSLIGLATQLAQRSVKRRYKALVWGTPHPPKGTINAPIGRDPKHRERFTVIPSGKEAITRYEVLETINKHWSLVECRLETGRTHQIRVHMRHIGHPIFGDPVYGGTKIKSVPLRKQGEVKEVLNALGRQALHAYLLSFQHPITGRHMSFEIPLYQDIQEAMNKLKTLFV
ncbi:MAG: RluA family pseudouridine synthase [Chlorobi bacterium]|nr:RluA family pseudouridine synthase [Chlorobiota bacterium]